MKITLRFFASVREALGDGQMSLTLTDDVTTVGQVRSLLAARGGVWAEALGDSRSLRMACNQVMCDGSAPLNEGCEVAFFPPVTGG